MESLEQQIKKLTADLGFDFVGICEALPIAHLNFFQHWIKQDYHAGMDYMQTSLPLRQNPQLLLPGARSIIAVALNYYQPNPSKVHMPHIATYALGRDYHKVIRKKLKKLASKLIEHYPDQSFRPCVDSAPIFEREYAHQAGLGWFGKNTCLINSHRGSYFFIGLLLTTLELQFDNPAFGSCGNCRKCIDACPTDAIIFENQRWQVNANKCISYWTIEHKGAIDPEIANKLRGWTFGCDICQEVCPFNKPRDHQPLRSQLTRELDFLQKKKWPDLVQLTQISYEDWDELTQGSPVRRAGWEGLKRNSGLNLEIINK